MNNDQSLARAITVVGSATSGRAPRPVVTSFFDPPTATVSYILHDPATRKAMVVDPVLQFTVSAARTSTVTADAIAAHVTAHSLSVDWIVETHVHADHLSAAALLRDRLGGRIVMGSMVAGVRQYFAGVYGIDPDTNSPFDLLLEDGDALPLGEVAGIALHVPGHTPADTAFVIGDVALTGDTLFMPDVGTARADFPGGDARTLFRSIKRLLSLPPQTRLLHCHDYPGDMRAAAWESTVGQQRARNIHVGGDRSEGGFVALREARDATLLLPELMLAAVQVNIDAGRLPAPADNGRRYLKLPLDTL